MFFPPRMRRNKDLTHVRFIHHRSFPAGIVKDVKVTRASVRPGSAWYVFFAIEMPKTAGETAYAATGLACGIDPGRKVPLTLAGENSRTSGLDGEEYGPGRPFTKATKKLRRLQRNLDRQTRANNPLCVETKWASLMSYGMTAKLLEDVLPMDDPLNAFTIRRHVWNVAERMEQDLGEEQSCFITGCQRDWKKLPVPDGPSPWVSTAATSVNSTSKGISK